MPTNPPAKKAAAAAKKASAPNTQRPPAASKQRQPEVNAPSAPVTYAEPMPNPEHAGRHGADLLTDR